MCRSKPGSTEAAVRAHLDPPLHPRKLQGCKWNQPTSGAMGRATLHWEQQLMLTAHGLNPQSSKSYVQNQNTHTQPSYTTARPEQSLAQPLPDPLPPSRVFFSQKSSSPPWINIWSYKIPRGCCIRSKETFSWGTYRGCSCKEFQPRPVLSSLPITHSRDKPARLSPLTGFNSSSELEKFFASSSSKTPSRQQLTLPTA